MTKKIDETQLIKDFEEGKHYAEIAIRYKCHTSTIAYRIKKLGLRRNRQDRELFSAEEKEFMRGLMHTHQGRKQLLYILKDE